MRHEAIKVVCAHVHQGVHQGFRLITNWVWNQRVRLPLTYLLLDWRARLSSLIHLGQVISDTSPLRVSEPSMFVRCLPLLLPFILVEKTVGLKGGFRNIFGPEIVAEGHIMGGKVHFSIHPTPDFPVFLPCNFSYSLALVYLIPSF